MWTNPDIQGWGLSPRGAGYLFGADITKGFTHTNAIDLIARAHQLAMEGYKLMFDQTIVTVWSAPNYCYRYVVSQNFAVINIARHAVQLPKHFIICHERIPHVWLEERLRVNPPAFCYPIHCLQFDYHQTKGVEFD